MIGKLRTILGTWKLGKAYVAGHYKQAVHIADSLLAIDSIDLPVLITAAECAHRAGMYDRAYQYADNVLKLEPGNLDALTIFTAVLVLDGRNEEAYKKAAEILNYGNCEGLGTTMEFEDLNSDRLLELGLRRRIAELIEGRNQDRIRLLTWCNDYKYWYETQNSQHPDLTRNSS